MPLLLLLPLAFPLSLLDHLEFPIPALPDLSVMYRSDVDDTRTFLVVVANSRLNISLFFFFLFCFG